MSKNSRGRGAFVLGRQAPRRQGRSRQALLMASRPFAFAVVVLILGGLVAAGLFPLLASAGAAVKVADSKFLGQVDVPLDLQLLHPCWLQGVLRERWPRRTRGSGA